ncbi:hotdog fold thioesterase [Pantoea sp. 1.19]|uniref:hotdog fold thioesterase n=1 Tax=Pantoea sp. 1.19 TaxID=1925589 RepID=UPI000948AD4A|nr:hotdog fold thioesterase [Pantoea sp. 1.19]
MSIWRREATLEALNAGCAGTLVSHCGICFTALTEEALEATMPVDSRTRQPFGLLHGGASVVLAESLGSLAGWLCTEGDAQVVGLEISAHHLRAVRDGVVRGHCRALHLGRRHQVWQTDIFDADGQLCCTARLTTSVR